MQNNNNKRNIMKLIKDNRETDIIFVDKYNNQVANNDETIKLINSDNTKFELYIDIIAISNNLNNNDKAIIRLIFNAENNIIDVTKLSNKFRIITAKSASTFCRSLMTLKDLKIIDIVNNNASINENYYIDYDKIINSKFIIIELDTNDTSKSINL